MPTVDSSTGGYLAPSDLHGDLNDDALIDALQAAVVGITGLPGQMVRPRWQPEAPDPPDPGTNWAAIGPDAGQQRDSFSAWMQDSALVGTVVRNRVIPILCTFYGPNAQGKAELMAMGFEVAQNREALGAQGLRLISGVTPTVIAPAQFKGKWYPRADVSFSVRQQQKYSYTVLDVLSATGTLVEDSTPPVSEPITVNPPA